jgi:pimeloyl-ACP methyl ester carboxylesterase
MTRPPRDIVVVRVLLVLTGFTSVINGLLEQNPTYQASSRIFGWLLVAFGVACWWLTYRLRRPGARRRTEVLVLMALLVAIRIYQVIRFGSPAAAAGVILPALVYWRASKPDTRAWLADGTGGRPKTSGGLRVFGALGAVGITIAALVVLTGAGAAVALWPCDFPTPATGSLSQSQLGPSTASTQPTGHVTATDSVLLAYYAYVPTNPVATLVFYHGSGANSAAGYLPLGRELANTYYVATYLFDIRGHGESGGPRGDAPTPDQVWQDTDTAVRFVHTAHPNLPEFVGGHSAGAGLVRNSMSRFDNLVSGYVFLSPDFGLHSNTELVSNAANFATVCQRPFVVNAISNGVLDGHATALGFGYTQADIDSAGLVPKYTVNMALAQNPDDSAADLAGLTKPLGLWVGANDEVFDPDKVIGYARANLKQSTKDTLAIVPKDNHLGILTDGASYLGPWIDAHSTTKPAPEGSGTGHR